MLKKIEIKKINEPCFDREHNPPNMMVYTPGTYEYACPTCKKKFNFTVNGVIS